MTIPAADVDWLERECRRLLDGCRRTAHDGTLIFTPDGSGHYGALWTRDFCYMVEGAGDLLPPSEIEAAIRYLLAGQRDDGAAPDRVQADGLAVYSAGPANHPLGAPPTDNSQFLVKLVWNYWKLTGRTELARAALPKLIRAMEAVPRRNGLVWIDPGVPRSPYGFTDTVAKTGFELFSTLLDWEGSRNLSELCDKFGEPACRKTFQRRAAEIERRLGVFWSAEKGALLAATVDCRQPDVWGNAYAIYIGVPLGRRQEVLDFLERHYERYAWHGQIRHLPVGEYWQRLLTKVDKDTYQNGGYWGTASGWVAYALALRRPEMAARVFSELIADYRGAGIYEWVHGETRRLRDYVASATNPRAALLKLRSEGRLTLR